MNNQEIQIKEGLVKKLNNLNPGEYLYTDENNQIRFAEKEREGYIFVREFFFGEKDPGMIDIYFKNNLKVNENKIALEMNFYLENDTSFKGEESYNRYMKLMETKNE